MNLSKESIKKTSTNCSKKDKNTLISYCRNTRIIRLVIYCSLRSKISQGLSFTKQLNIISLLAKKISHNISSNSPKNQRVNYRTNTSWVPFPNNFGLVWLCLLSTTPTTTDSYGISNPSYFKNTTTTKLS